MRMGDTCYPKFVPFALDEFELHLHFYYFNGLSPSLRIQVKFKSRSVDPVHFNDFLHKISGHNYVRQQKEFKFCFA